MPEKQFCRDKRLSLRKASGGFFHPTPVAESGLRKAQEYRSMPRPCCHARARPSGPGLNTLEAIQLGWQSGWPSDIRFVQPPF
ncbi:hypothetical protein LAB1_11930 [Roseibium sp. LAB1]